jgi:choline dehydrogenase-like flavoprotein
MGNGDRRAQPAEAGPEKRAAAVALHVGAGRMATLHALASAVVPRGGSFPLGADDVDTAGRLADYLSRFPTAQRRALLLLVTAWEYLPLFSRYRRPFSRLTQPEREAFLREAEGSRLPPRRLAAFWLKTLCLMAFTSDPQVSQALGYTSAEGGCLDETPPAEGPHLNPIAYPEIHGRVELTADVCVVGSGAGGAVIARELAEGGLSVVVIEEGGYFTREDFQGPPFERILRLYRDGGLTAAVGRGIVPVPLGKAVGGTTVVNSGTCFWPPDHVLHEWGSRWGIEGIDPDSMKPILRRVEETISVRPVPDHLLGSNARVFQRGVHALGYHGAPLGRAIDGCRGCGVCAFGCPSDAKQAMHLSYLPRAEAAGARIYARCRVDRMEVEGGRVLTVEADVLEQQSDRVRGRLRVHPKLVVVAAGALHTPLLLMSNGLGGASGQVGRNLSIHPAVSVSALFDEEVYAWRGTMQSYYMDDFASDGLLFEVTSLLPGVATAMLPGVGAAMKESLARSKHLASVGLFVSDTSRGRVLCLPVRQAGLPGARSGPVVLYNLNRHDATRLVRGIAIAAEVFLEAGAKAVYPGLRGTGAVASRRDLEQLRRGDWGSAALSPTGFHPMGTCRMGRDPASAVVDQYGRLHGVRNLFVADASVFPSCLGVNPQVTIMALATRSAQHILERPDRYLS